MNEKDKYALRETGKLIGPVLGGLAGMAAYGLPVMWAFTNGNITLILVFTIGLPMLVGIVWYYIETRNEYGK